MPADEDVHEARHVAAASAKARGSKAYGEGDCALASRSFGEAIAVATSDEPDLAIKRSNTFAARFQRGDLAGAENEATECTRLAPKWAKGWSRLGNCLSRQPERAGGAERALKTAISWEAKTPPRRSPRCVRAARQMPALETPGVRLCRD